MRFIGQATGTGSDGNINIPTIYLQGTVPDAENLIGVPLTLQLAINPGSIVLTLLENGRVLTSLVHPPQYAGSINGQFFGVGNGEFVPA